jgi:hypothetical protein
MSELAGVLNLAKHTVNNKEMALCTDIECHLTKSRDLPDR